MGLGGEGVLHEILSDALGLSVLVVPLGHAVSGCALLQSLEEGLVLDAYLGDVPLALGAVQAVDLKAGYRAQRAQSYLGCTSGAAGPA